MSSEQSRRSSFKQSGGLSETEGRKLLVRAFLHRKKVAGAKRKTAVSAMPSTSGLTPMCHRPLCSSPFWAVLRSVSWGNSGAPRIYAVLVRPCIWACRLAASWSICLICLLHATRRVFTSFNFGKYGRCFRASVTHRQIDHSGKIESIFCYFAVAMKVYFKLCFVMFQMQLQEFDSISYAAIYFQILSPDVQYSESGLWHAMRLKFTFVW